VLHGFDRAVDLGPQFAPYYIHVIQGALFRGDTARTRQLLEEYRGVAGEDDRWAAASLLRILLLDPEAEIPAEFPPETRTFPSLGEPRALRRVRRRSNLGAA
jgi:hypothetical protein